MDILQQLAYAAGIDFAVLAAIGVLFAFYRLIRRPSTFLQLFVLALKCAVLFVVAFSLYVLGSIGAAPTPFFIGLTSAIGLLGLAGAADIASSCRETDAHAFRFLIGLALAALLFFAALFVSAWLGGIVIAVVAFIVIVQCVLPLAVMLLLLAWL